MLLRLLGIALMAVWPAVIWLTDLLDDAHPALLVFSLIAVVFAGSALLQTRWAALIAPAVIFLIPLALAGELGELVDPYDVGLAGRLLIDALWLVPTALVGLLGGWLGSAYLDGDARLGDTPREA